MRTNRRVLLIVSLFLLALASANAGANSVSLWKLDEGSGTTASDSIGTNHGTLINEPNWGPGVDGNCIEFDGVNDYIEVPDDNSLDFAAGQDFSIAFWFTVERPTYTVAQDMLDKRESGGDEKGWHVYYESCDTQFNYRRVVLRMHKGQSYASIKSNTYVDDGQWHHLVLVRQGINYSLYVDGTLHAAYDMSGWDAAWVNSSPLRFGVDESLTGFFEGGIDEVAIYDMALSPGDIAQLYYGFEKAYAPNPEDGAMEVVLSTDLSWCPYSGAISQEVFFGTVSGSLLSVASGDGTLNSVSNAQIGGPLEFDKTYYWRVDTDGRTGDEWNFTTYENIRPVADAGPDQSFSATPPLVTLDGRGSFDVDSDPLSYHWQQIYGPVVEIDDANSAITTFSPAEYGAYIFELVVNDGSLDSFADSVNIVVGGGRVPVADAGSSRYAGTGSVQLDGTGSYDPDASGAISYQWQQISGPTAIITDANTATPTISGFTQTDEIQNCEFELVVNDGECNSLPDTVEVLIVPDFTGVVLFLENPYFDPNKPTIIHFSGGNGGRSTNPNYLYTNFWYERVNLINFTNLYSDVDYDYEAYGDAIISYLSSVAPNYRQPIQIEGCSAGTVPAIVVSKYLNFTYNDYRYAVNRITLLDGFGSYEPYLTYIQEILANTVAQEQIWVDNYETALGDPIYHPGVLNVSFAKNDDPNIDKDYKHELPWYWWRTSYDSPMSNFNNGVVAGWYWSVAGPGKNLQLASTSSSSPYHFKWFGSFNSGYMDFYDEGNYPGRLPEPVTLIDPPADIEKNGLLLTCEESENAVGYQLLAGTDPYRVMDYNIISDTPAPPANIIHTSPCGSIYWWTVKARDQYGSTIYADPIYSCKSDFNRDGIVDGRDLAEFAKYWLEDSVAAWYKLDETSGLITDDSGGNRDGTLINFPGDDSQWVSGYFGNALNFDGLNDYVSIPPLNLYSNTVTISAWIKRNGEQSDPIGFTGIVFNRAGSTAAGISLGYKGNGTGNNLRYNWNSVTAGWDSGLTVPDGQWVFVALVVEPAKATMYLYDGTMHSATNTVSHAIEEFDNVTCIGLDPSPAYSRYFKGTIDDVRIHNAALSEAELIIVKDGGQTEAYYPSPANLYKDRIINFKDYAIFSSWWLKD